MKIVADKNIPFVEDCFGELGDVSVFDGRQIDASTVADADVLLVRSVTKVDKKLLGGSCVKFVATATIGVDHIDQEYLAAEGIGFASAQGSNSNSVAEYVIAAILAIGKKLRTQLEGKSIGVVGVGNVGSKVAKKAAALGMEVVLNDPPLQRETGDAKYRPLAKVLDCDFVTVHTPLTLAGADKTFHLADADFFNAMKGDAFFINSARGGVMDTAALKAALKSKQIAGAMIDVWEDEPIIDNELLLMVDISTPHVAGYSLDGKIGGMVMIYEQTCEFFGEVVEHMAEDFLPEPTVPEIEVSQSDDEQKAIQDVVQQVYVINRDDFNTREILIVPADERADWFDGLRKDYPVRREFQNTQILFDDKLSPLAEKLRGIGFKV